MKSICLILAATFYAAAAMSATPPSSDPYAALSAELDRRAATEQFSGAALVAKDGKVVYSAGRDTTVRGWRVEDGKLLHELGKGRGGQFKDWLHAVSFNADGTWLAAADMAGAGQVWIL